MPDEKRIELTGFFGQMLGIWYPKNCVVAVIDDETEARHALADFQAAGFAPDDVRLFTSAEVVEIEAQMRKQLNPVQRVMATISSGADEAQAMDHYLSEAHAGHNILAVRVGHRDTPDPRVRPIMEAHHAHSITIYDDLTVMHPGA